MVVVVVVALVVVVILVVVLNAIYIYIYSILTVVETTKVYNKHTNNKEYAALLGLANGTMIETS